MNAEVTNPRADEDTLTPSLKFDLDLETDSNELSSHDGIPIEVGGHIEGKDGIKIGDITESRGRHDSNPRKQTLHAIRKTGQSWSENYPVQLVSEIGDEGVEYLDKLRKETRKEVVILHVVLNIRTLEANFTIPSIENIESSQINEDISEELQGRHKGILGYSWDNNTKSGANRKDLWLVASENTNEILSVNTRTFDERLDITMREWTDEILPELGFGNSLILDNPDPIDAINENTEKVRNAIGDLNNAREYMKEGKWGAAVHELESAMDRIDDDSAEELWELDGYGAVKGQLQDFGKSYREIFGKYRKGTTQDGDHRERVQPTREDVFFLYSTTAGLIQLLNNHYIKENFD